MRKRQGELISDRFLAFIEQEHTEGAEDELLEATNRREKLSLEIKELKAEIQRVKESSAAMKLESAEQRARFQINQVCTHYLVW